MLLQRLLRLMAEDEGPTAVHELAGRLSVSAGLVEQMIEQMVRLGYLKTVNPGCSAGTCSRCSQASLCSMQPRARLWTVTERGRRLAARRSVSA